MSTLSGSIEGARGSVEVHEYLASNLHPGRCQVCAPFLMFVNGAIALCDRPQNKCYRKAGGCLKPGVTNEAGKEAP